MSIKIQQLGPLPAQLTAAVFDFFSPKEIVNTINCVQSSWNRYMSSGSLNLNSLPITDHNLSNILLNSRLTYPNKSLTYLTLNNCTKLTITSGKRISEMDTLTHLSLADCAEYGVAWGLTAMPHLLYLDLSGNLTWNSEVIAQCSSLEVLILQGCACCDEDLESLETLSLVELDISDNSDLTPDSVPYLNGMTSLEVLDITDTLIPPEQVERPGLDVYTTSGIRLEHIL